MGFIYDIFASFSVSITCFLLSAIRVWSSCIASSYHCSNNSTRAYCSIELVFHIILLSIFCAAFVTSIEATTNPILHQGMAMFLLNPSMMIMRFLSCSLAMLLILGYVISKVKSLYISSVIM